MNIIWMFLALLVGVLPSVSSAQATPAYCDKQTFLSREIPLPDRLTFRGHAFRLGRATIIGLGLGFSQTDEVSELARAFSPAASSSNGFLTWYLSDEYVSSMERFNDFPLPSPRKGDFDPADRPELVNTFDRTFASMLDPSSNHSILVGLESHSYFALGCDSQKHRGPTVFGMVLAASGCTAEQSAAIVNAIWQLNGVPKDLRLEIIARAAKIGEEHPEWRERLRQALESRAATPPAAPENDRAALDRAHYTTALEGSMHDRVRTSTFEDWGLKTYRVLAYNPHIERAKSLKKLFTQISHGLPYAEAIQNSYTYWNKRMIGVGEQDAYRFTPVFFEERILISEAYLGHK